MPTVNAIKPRAKIIRTKRMNIWTIPQELAVRDHSHFYWEQGLSNKKAAFNQLGLKMIETIEKSAGKNQATLLGYDSSDRLVRTLSSELDEKDKIIKESDTTITNATNWIRTVFGLVPKRKIETTTTKTMVSPVCHQVISTNSKVRYERT